MGWEDVHWSHLTQGGDQRETLVNTVWNFEFHKTEAKELLASQLVLRPMDNQLNFVFHAKGRTMIGDGGLRTGYWIVYLDVTGGYRKLERPAQWQIP